MLGVALLVTHSVCGTPLFRSFILALGEYPQAMTFLRAVEKMLVENYPIPCLAFVVRRGPGNFWNHLMVVFLKTQALDVQR